jgi:hypothetical protein
LNRSAIFFLKKPVSSKYREESEKSETDLTVKYEPEPLTPGIPAPEKNHDRFLLQLEYGTSLNGLLD